ncbi:acetylcholinesterase [Amyelois transitella]|uniref:acetylcholinesterase n=1 Tax=Amyelois transitella TaxID=680683 RepID=UPI00298FC9B3|nr:acetylcholinesterase [Amyelois transitella]
MSRKWLVLWSLWAARLVRQPTIPLRVSGGWLRGSVANDGSHIAYYGIPYATAPERFQSPVPNPVWDGIFEATKENVWCIQRYSKDKIVGQENCLVVNVYTPLQTKKSLFPVMVYIHGGGFREGSGTRLENSRGDYLTEHGVIVVTFNYRLEILGFLCLGIKEAPGNAGLKDQNAALKWVKKNIKSFGGDPDNITLFGESAGAASVYFHSVSPMSKGLFNKAIMQSGTAIAHWALQHDPLKSASQLAQQMGHNTEDPNELYNIFRYKSADELFLTRVPRAKGKTIISEYVFTPCIEKKITDVETFLSDNPYNMTVNSQFEKLPVMIGHNDAEGYLFARNENDSMIENLNFRDSLPDDLEFQNNEEKMKTAELLKSMYMGRDDINKDTMPKISFYYGDSSLIFPVIFTADLLLKHSDYPVFSYKFSYDGWMNFPKFLYGFPMEPGATHIDELFYMFKFKMPLINAFLERDMIDKITTMWTNFAKYSDPTPEISGLLPVKWEPVRREDPRLLVIDKELSMEPLWYSERLLFWNETYSKYRKILSAR